MPRKPALFPPPRNIDAVFRNINITSDSDRFLAKKGLDAEDSANVHLANKAVMEESQSIKPIKED
jgi:hypothetical protein